MTKLEDAIFEANMCRERKHRGEPQNCEKCGRPGVVGESLVAAHTITTFSEWSWWGHRTCLPRDPKDF